MIWESSYWKNDLLRRAALLRKRMRQRRWPDRSYARVEQEMMLGFYAIRKLLEAKKLSDSIAQTTLRLSTYPLLDGKLVTRMNWHHVDELYDMSSPTPKSHSLAFVCNQFIHSYVFTFDFDPDGSLAGVLFASDRQRHSRLLSITAQQIVDVFESVGNDCPASSRMNWDEALGDYRVTNE